ncbi:transcriptional regulator [Salmonella enterica]|nr:transcriptional regulator [Salmonella enterica]
MRKNTHQTDNPQVRRLNEIIEKKRISKADIARICGVSAQSVNNWFVEGSNKVKALTIKLADALGVSLEWVLGQDVDAKDGLRHDERRLLELYNQLPNEEEQQNMLRIVSLRLKELDELYAKYMGRRIKGDTE